MSLKKTQLIMHGQRRILKRNRPSESKDDFASTSKPKKPKGDLKRYELISFDY